MYLKRKKSYDYKSNLIHLLQRKINIYDTVNKNVGNYFLNILLNIAKLDIFYSFISYIILLWLYFQHIKNFSLLIDQICKRN